jgi:hypothetical protein
MLTEQVYRKAKKRGFIVDHETEDWLKIEIKQL